jgi:hypothetical protein
MAHGPARYDGGWSMTVGEAMLLPQHVTLIAASGIADDVV